MKNRGKKLMYLSEKRRAVISSRNKFVKRQRAVLSHGVKLDDGDFVRLLDNQISSGVVQARNAGIPYTIVKGADIVRVEGKVEVKVGTVTHQDVVCTKKSFKIK